MFQMNMLVGISILKLMGIFLYTLRKYLFRHAKGKSMVNFYIALGQNLTNSESCSILRLCVCSKRPKSVISGNLS